MLFKDLQNCTQGFFCSLGASDPNPVSESFGDQCRAGSFCPAGASGPTYCPIGKRLHQNVVRQLSFHSTMKEKREEMETERHTYHIMQLITSDFFTFSSISLSYLMVMNFFIPFLGTYLEEEQQFPKKDGSMPCNMCPKGSFCNEIGLSRTGRECSERFYCPTGSNSSHPKGKACPEHYFCPRGSEKPTICPGGRYSLRGKWIVLVKCYDLLRCYKCHKLW